MAATTTAAEGARQSWQDKDHSRQWTDLGRCCGVTLQVCHLFALKGRVVEAGDDKARVVEDALNVDV